MQSLIVQLAKLLDHDWRAKSKENPPMVLATKINAEANATDQGDFVFSIVELKTYHEAMNGSHA